MAKAQLLTLHPDAEACLEAVGNAIRRARLARGDTQAQAAERAGVALSTFKRLEQGDPGVAAGTLMTLLAIYGRTEQMFQLADDDEQTRLLALRRLPTNGRPNRARKDTR